MRISECLNDENAAINAFNKLEEVNEKYNFLVTPVNPKEAISDGLLKDVPIALKDNVNTKGIRTTASCKILDNYVPVYNATIVDKLEKAGARIVCKTSMDELAMGGTNLTAATGPVLNPYDTTRISGGSSGGSAVAVASGLVPCAIGSDTGDSVRKPASFCGVVGVKPTYGRISRYGIIPYASSLDHVGYFTTNVKDAATMLEVLAGRDDNDMTSSNEPVLEYTKLINEDIAGKKILVFKNVTDSISNQEVLNHFNKIVDGLKEKGAVVEEVSFDEKLMKAILPVYYIIANCEATANHSNLDGVNFGNTVEGDSVDEIMTNTRTKNFGIGLKTRFFIGSYGLAQENQERYFRKAQRIRRLIVDEVMNKLKDADLLIAPAAPGVAPKVVGTSNNELDNEYLIADNHMVIGNFAGLPSMTLPMGYVDDMPVGININANPFKEDVMFSIGKVIENITGLEGKVKGE